MWKHFFYFSKADRRAIVMLLAVLILLVGGNLWLKEKQGKALLPSATDNESVDSFLANVRKKERLHRRSSPMHSSPTVTVLFPFDPNTADSTTLSDLGLSDFVISNILKYRAKGGIFRTPEAFRRIYGLTSEQYEALHPYVRIGIHNRLRRQDTAMSRSATVSRDSTTLYPVTVKYVEGTVIDLNMADTVMLKHIPGIGSGLARMIVAYRNRLGGFHAVSQLQEIPYIDTLVNRWFRITTPPFRKLRVNHSNLDRLRSHPYMDFYKAKAIIEYRRKRGNLKDIAQLSLFEEFSEEDLKRLMPYLSFE